MDGLITAWRATAKAEGIVLLGPTAFRPGAWYIPEDSPDFTRDVVEACQAQVPDRPAASLSVRPLRRRAIPQPAARCARTGVFRRRRRACRRAARRFHASAPTRPPENPDGHLDRARRQNRPARLRPPDCTRSCSARDFRPSWSRCRRHGHNFNERADETVQQAWKFLRDKHLNKDPIYQPYKFGGA